MNYSTAVFLINDHVRAIEVSYEEGGKPGVFKTLDAAIKKDDLVVVPTNTRYKFTVAKVTAVDVDVDYDRQDDMAWIVSPAIDLAAHKQVIEQEKVAVEAVKSAVTRKKREELSVALLADKKASLATLELAAFATPAVASDPAAS